MRRAKISVHAADVKNVLRSFSIEVPAGSVEDLQEVRLIFLFRFLTFSEASPSSIVLSTAPLMRS